jgi:N-acetylmuramoyl-L-alanine amidase
MSWRAAAIRLVAVAVVIGIAWVLAPASPAERAPAQRPAARDFEQPLPAVARVTAATRTAGDEHADHPGEGPVTFRSPVVVAPARFDAVGLAEELRPLELRARDSRGEWGEWIEVANGDPAWFGGADELQLRTRGWRPEGTLHYVNVTRGATKEPPTKPRIISRKRWGANRKQGGCRPRQRAEYGRVKATVVHHTVGSNKYSEADAPDVVLAICRYHRNALGWNDIGYNALVDRFGNIYTGRAGGLESAVVGAQAQGVNAQTSGVAVMGTHTKLKAGTAAMRGLTRWLAWKLQVHGHDTTGRPRLVSAGGDTSRYGKGESFRVRRIIGHRRTNVTACPGDSLNRQLRALRRRVQEKIDKAGGGDDGGAGGIGG